MRLSQGLAARLGAVSVPAGAPGGGERQAVQSDFRAPGGLRGLGMKLIGRSTAERASWSHGRGRFRRKRDEKTWKHPRFGCRNDLSIASGASKGGVVGVLVAAGKATVLAAISHAYAWPMASKRWCFGLRRSFNWLQHGLDPRHLAIEEPLKPCTKRAEALRSPLKPSESSSFSLELASTQW